jgi:long-subunit fatty acid transport protein
MNRTIRLSACLVAALLIFAAATTTDSLAQTADDGLRLSERDPATGTRLGGMAGAGGIAGTADLGALFSNPAGLGFLRQSILSGSLNSFSTREDARFVTPEFSGSLDRDVRDMRIGNLGYAYRVPTSRGSFVVGAGINQVREFGRGFQFVGTNASSSVTDVFMPASSDFEVREDDEGFYPRFFRDLSALAYEAGAIEFLYENVGTGSPLFDQAVFPGSRIDQEGDVFEEGHATELSFGGAVEAAENVMVGLSVNVVYGRYRFNSVLEEIDVAGENEDYVVIVGNQQLSGLDFLRYEQGVESEIGGVNLRGGVSALVTPNVRVGFTIESPTFKRISEVYWQDLETFFLTGGSLASSREGDYDYNLRTPWRLGAGVAYVAPSFTIGLDAEFIDWTQMRFSTDLASDEAYFDGLNRDIRDLYDPVANVRIGGEYRLGDLALRAGVAHFPDPRSNSGDSGNVDRSRSYVSTGVGYTFNQQFTLNAGWTGESFSDRYRPYTVSNGPVIEEDVFRSRFSVGATIRF